MRFLKYILIGLLFCSPLYAQGIDEDTKLMLHFDGGDSSRKIIDSGRVEHIVTQVATADIYPTNRQFGNNAARMADNQYFTIPDHADWNNYQGTNLWTIEAFIYVLDDANFNVIFCNGETADTMHAMYVWAQSNILYWQLREGSTIAYAYTPSGSLSVNKWHHVAVSRYAATGGSGNEIKMFIDGVDQTLTWHTAFSSAHSIEAFEGDGIRIGDSVTTAQWGSFYIDELRVRSVGSSTMSVPTSEYSSNGDTDLLMHFNEDATNDFTDDDGNTGHTVTAVNGAGSPSYFGSGGLFVDGNSDYLTIPDHVDWNIFGDQSEDYTVEYFFKLDDGAEVNGVMMGHENGTDYWLSGITTNKMRMIFADSDSGTENCIGTVSIADTEWHHYSFIKLGNSPWEAAVYVDGTQICYVTAAYEEDISSLLFIGGINYANLWAGKMDEVRIQKSNPYGVSASDGGTMDTTSPYAGTITVPTEPHTSDENTKLLLHFDSHDSSGDGSTTGKAYHDTTWTGTAQLRNGHSKFGGASARFNYSDNYITVPDHADWDVVASLSTDYVVEAWVKRRRYLGHSMWLISQRAGSYDKWYVSINNSGNAVFSAYKPPSNQFISINTGDGILVDDEWHHVMMVKRGASYATYVDGDQQGYQLVTEINTCATNPLYIGTDSSGTEDMDGWIDEVRIQNSDAYSVTVAATDPTGNWMDNSGSHNGTITVSTSAHTSDSYTHLLLHLDHDVSDDGNTSHTPVENGTDAMFPGYFNGGAVFDGTGDSITIPDSLDWDIAADNTEDWTLDLWLNTTSVASTVAIIDQHEETNNWWALYNSAVSGLTYVVRTGGVNTISVVQGSSTLTANSWSHISVIKTGTTISNYLNGTRVATTTDSDVDSYDAVLRIGALGVTPTYFSGSMDEIRIAKDNYLGAASDTSITPPIIAYSVEEISGKKIINIAKMIKREDGGYDRISWKQNFGWNGIKERGYY